MNRRVIGIALLPGLMLMAGCAVLATMGYRINITPSLPMGVWQRVEREGARYVEFCMPAGTFARLVSERDYLPVGRCPNNMAPLLKPVVARAGDQVDITQSGLKINGQTVLNHSPESSDSRGRPLPVIGIGSTMVAPGRLWVVSTHHPRSLDSRYFGSISESSVVAGMRPVWVINDSSERHAHAR